MEKKNRGLLHVAICVGLVCLIWMGYFLIKHYGTDRILEIKEDDFSWVYQVDKVGSEGNDFVLKGFAFELDKDAVEGAFEIILQDIETGKRFFPEMKYMERADVNEYFFCEYDYLQSGFEAVIKEKKLELDERDYEVLLRRKGERESYQTGTYISKGILMYTNPKEFEPLDVEGIDLELIVEKGVLRVYEPENHMYVYQYEGELYWIADEEYEFVDEDIDMQCYVRTTQVEKLPEKCLESGRNWDNISFMFSTNEVDNLNTGKYRVAKKRIPTEYSIERIEIGSYIKGWVWKNEFRPRYEFKGD